MNNVAIVGRLTRDPDIRYTQGGLSIARLNVAVDRRFKKDGEDTADFINCVAFSKTAEFIEKYFTKGQRIGFTGRIQTGSYEKEDGTRVYTTDVVIENCEFVESKGSGNQGGQSSRPNPVDANGFMNIPDDVGDAGLPFN